MAKRRTLSDNDIIRYLKKQNDPMMDRIAERLEEITAKHPQSNWRETEKKTAGGQHIYRCAACGKTVASYRSATMVNMDYPYCHCGCEMINPY